MRVFASSFHAWKSLEKSSGSKHEHGLVFPLAIVEAIGAPHGLEPLVPEEKTRKAVNVDNFDAIFISVLDTRNLINAAKHFQKWRVPFRWEEREPGHYPMVWAGGQGLFNPLPMALSADLIVLGDAEDSLPLLINEWHNHGNSFRFLDAAADTPGVYVPRIHGWETPPQLQRGVSETITTTLDTPVKVNTTDMRRVEIARGCKFACRFCSLGWNQPYRENSAEAIVKACSGKEGRVHLQAGDAESHSQIVEIRDRLSHKIESGWTGRYDTALQTRKKMIRTHFEGWKRHAVGVEGLTWPLRRLVGKGYLTDERLITDTSTYLSMIEPGSQGRLVWHMMAGLPGEKFGDVFTFRDLLEDLDNRRLDTGEERRNLALHWQPFQPLPGTPMQWFGAGKGARRIAGLLEETTSELLTLNCWHQEGRTNRFANYCAALGRSDAEGGALFLERFAQPKVKISTKDAEDLTGQTTGYLETDETPWDFVLHPKQRDRLIKVRDGMLQQLDDIDTPDPNYDLTDTPEGPCA